MTTSVGNLTLTPRFVLTMATLIALTVAWPTTANAANLEPTSAVSAGKTATNVALPANINSGYDDYVYVSSTKVDFRSGASPSSSVKATAYRDSRILATGNQRGNWREFQVRGVFGWAPANHFTHSKPSASPIRVTVTKRTLHLRFYPGASSSVETTAYKSDRGIFTGVQRGGWWEIKINGVYSWAPSKDVSVGGFYSPSKALQVGHNQVGYREPSWRNNKYNSWINGNNAWCGVFVSWVYAHSGYRNGVPQRKHFNDFYGDARRSGVLNYNPKSSELEKGDVVLMDWGRSGGPSHAGIVDRVSGNTLWLVEGNTTDGTGNSDRGVFHRQRGLVSVHSSFRPSEYALATR